MQLNRNLAVAALSLASFVCAGGHLLAEDAGEKPRTDTTQYLVELSEYELEKPIPTGLAEDAVVEAIRNAKTKPVETIRLTAVSETESLVQVGKSVSVTNDTMTRGDTTTRRFTDIEIGTILRLKIKPHSKGAIADISYTTSRVDGDTDGDTRPNVLSNTVQSTQVYVLGSPRLLTTVGADRITGILITVRDIADH